MKGVVLAGGLGTRLAPMTRVVNKHLLDVFDEPMVHFPIRMLAAAGISEIVLVTGAEMSQFRELLGDGNHLGVDLVYEQQDAGDRGIADALAKARPHVDGDLITVALGDNIFQDDLSPYIQAFTRQQRGAKLLVKPVARDDAKRFGVVEIHDGRAIGIEEKPADPRSNLVVTGCYMYDSDVFDIIATLTPSARGELEITAVNNTYIGQLNVTYDILRGWWTDAGTPASKLKASIMVALEKGVHFHA
jgi:glucose-1-phosphate thymidylyltransferase